MSNSRKQYSIESENIGDPDRLQDPSNWDQDGLENASNSVVRSKDVAMRQANDDGGLTERLTGIFFEEGDGDLLLQQNGGVFAALQWLQAFDFQVMGVCHADERLKPLLKLDVSGATAEDCLLAHLSQHFEASEVGSATRSRLRPVHKGFVDDKLRPGLKPQPVAVKLLDLDGMQGHRE